MKNFIKYIIFILLIGSSMPCSSDETIVGDLIITNEKVDNGRKFIKAVFSIKADPEKVYYTLRNVEKFPEFMPGSAEVEILEKGIDYQVVKFSGSRGLLNGDIIMKRTNDDNKKRIEWLLVDGPPREVCGYWFVERDATSESVAIVHYANYVDAGALIPDFLVRKYLCDDIKKMVPNIVKRVISGGIWMSDEYRKKVSIKKPHDFHMKS